MFYSVGLGFCFTVELELWTVELKKLLPLFFVWLWVRCYFDFVYLFGGRAGCLGSPGYIIIAPHALFWHQGRLPVTVNSLRRLSMRETCTPTAIHHISRW